MDANELRERVVRLVNRYITFNSQLRDGLRFDEMPELARKMRRIDELNRAGNPADFGELNTLITEVNRSMEQGDESIRLQRCERDGMAAARLRQERDERFARLTPAEVITLIERDGYFTLEVDARGQVICRPRGLDVDKAVAVRSHLGPIEELLQQRQAFDVIG